MSRNARITLIALVVLAVVILAYLLGRRTRDVAIDATPAPTVSTTATPTATPTPGVPRCHTADLTLTVGQANGAAGTSYIGIGLTNKSTVTCTIYGYPGASVLDSAGTQLGAAAVRSTTITPALITLAAGQEAHAALGFPNAGNFDPGKCSAASTTLRLYAPDESTALTAPLIQQNCPGFSVTAFSTAVQ